MTCCFLNHSAQCMFNYLAYIHWYVSVSYTHLDVYKRQRSREHKWNYFSVQKTILEIKQDTSQELNFIRQLQCPYWYISKMWVMTKKEFPWIQRCEIQFLQNAFSYMLQVRRNADIRSKLELKEINYSIISTYRRQWCDHLQRMAEKQLPKMVLK